MAKSLAPLLLVAAVAALVRAQTLTVFVDDHEFRQAARRAGLEVTAFSISAANLALAQAAQDVSSLPVQQKSKVVNIGGKLAFDSEKTLLPLSFELTKRINGAEDGDEFGYARSDVEGHVKSDLHMGVRHVNDDFQLTFSTIAFHESRPYTQLFAFAIVMAGNTRSKRESLIVHDPFGNIIGTISEIPVSSKETFLGIVSTVPIGGCHFDEDADDVDVVLLHQLLFGVGLADLLDGVPTETQVVFWAGTTAAYFAASFPFTRMQGSTCLCS